MPHGSEGDHSTPLNPDAADWVYDTDTGEDWTLTHWVVRGGLRLESRLETAKGTGLLAVGWSNLAKARANYENARDAALKRVEEVNGEIAALRASQTGRSRLWTLWEDERGHLLFYLNSGPPTWWLPRFAVMLDDKYGVKAGWIRGMFLIAWKPSPDYEREVVSWVHDASPAGHA